MNNVKKNIVFSWVFSYAVVICVMLVAISIASNIYISSIKRVSKEFNSYIFDTVSDDAKELLISLNDLYLKITENENLPAMVRDNTDLHFQNYTYDLINDLRAYCQYAEKADEVFVYIKDKDMIVFSGGLIPSITYFKTYIKQGSISYEDWISVLTECSGISYSSLKYMNKENKDVDNLSMIFPIPKTYNNCVGVILSDKRYFMNGLEKINWDDICDIYIYNSDGKLVTYSIHSDAANVPEHMDDISKLKNDDVMLNSSEIVINGNTWSIITATRENDIKKDLVLRQTLAIGIILSSLVILVFIIKCIINRNYKPIATMFSIFKLDNDGNNERYENLIEAINNTLSENNSMAKELSNYEKTIQNHNIATLLKGENSYYFQEDAQQVFEGDYFSVLIFDISSGDKLFSNDESMSNYERQKHLLFIIDNVMNDLMQNLNTKVYTTEVNSRIVCLLCSREKPEINTLDNTAYKGMEFINENFLISLTYAVSAVCEGIFNVPNGYRQAAEVMEYKRALGISEPLQYIEKTHHQQDQYIFDESKEQVMISAIKAGNQQAALSALNQTISELSAINNLTVDHIICVALDIVSSVKKAVNEITNSGIDFNYSLEMCKMLREGVVLSDLSNQLSEYISQACDIVKNENQSNKSRTHFLMSHIEKYIADNYASTELNVNSIGAFFNMNSQYISAVFKKEKGETMLEYINHTRIEHALRLIKEGKYPKREIAKMVGFTTERTFYRVLKKYEQDNEE